MARKNNETSYQGQWSVQSIGNGGFAQYGPKNSFKQEVNSAGDGKTESKNDESEAKSKASDHKKEADEGDKLKASNDTETAKHVIKKSKELPSLRVSMQIFLKGKPTSPIVLAESLNRNEPITELPMVMNVRKTGEAWKLVLTHEHGDSCFLDIDVNSDPLLSLGSKTMSPQIRVLVHRGLYLWGYSEEAHVIRLVSRPEDDPSGKDLIKLGNIFGQLMIPINEFRRKGLYDVDKTKKLESALDQLAYLKRRIRNYDIEKLEESVQLAFIKLFKNCGKGDAKRQACEYGKYMAEEVGPFFVISGFRQRMMKKYDNVKTWFAPDTELSIVYNKVKSSNKHILPGSGCSNLEYCCQILKAYLIQAGYPFDN